VVTTFAALREDRARRAARPETGLRSLGTGHGRTGIGSRALGIGHSRTGIGLRLLGGGRGGGGRHEDQGGHHRVQLDLHAMINERRAVVAVQARMRSASIMPSVVPLLTILMVCLAMGRPLRLKTTALTWRGGPPLRFTVSWKAPSR
jgi:hypothetical protein